MAKFTSILYWKWGYPVFEGENLKNSLLDIIARSSFETLYVSFHHVDYPFSDPRILGAVRLCNEILVANNRKLLLDIDARNEGLEFERLHPGQKGFFSRFLETRLDSNGSGHIDIKNLEVAKVGRKASHNPPESIINSWVFDLVDRFRYDPDTVENVKDKTQIQALDEWRTRINIDAGPENAGKTALVFPAIRHAIPDPFSPKLYGFFSTMFELVKDIPISGAATDEWGFELALENEGDRYFSKHFPYSPYMDLEFADLTGTPLHDALIHFAYSPVGDRDMSMATVSAYLEVLRAKMKENNDWFYDKTKEIFGTGAFVGVHPTFWGDPTDFYLDTILNGLDWWEVKRDFAQTDEWVLIPIRLALSRKWGGKVWYNMWYSGNTNIKETYFEETWANARFGGRTHYLGYECPNEPGVLPLKQEGLLEEMSLMEEKIGILNEFQESQPDSRVLVIFGMEAVSCWNIADPGARDWNRNGGTLNKVLKFAKNLFDSGFLCDLAPSSEIVNQSITIRQGKAAYVKQDYDAVIFLLPQGIRREVLGFLEEYLSVNKKLILVGDCGVFSDGMDASGAFRALRSGLPFWYKDFPETSDVIEVLANWGVPKNTFENGCVYQDGSAIFTANGAKAIGNPLKVDAEVQGHRVQFDGSDFLAIRISPDGAAQVASGECRSLAVSKL
jgi:hypothetical protein